MPKLGLGLDLSSQKSNSNNLLLDEFSGAIAAYSLRYLYDSYAGDVILVRRSIDNAEQGFTPSEIESGDLESFCGAGNGFIKTWYDQSVNSFNVTQNTNLSQPQIVSSGSLIQNNSKPSIQFTGLESLSNNTTSVSSSIYSAFMTASCDVRSTSRTLLRCRLLGAYGSVEGASFLEFDSTENNVNIFFDDGSGNSIGVSNSSFINDGSFNLTTTILTSTTGNTWINGSNVGGNNSVESGSTPIGEVSLPFIDVGGGEVSRFWDGLVSELILFTSDQSANRTAIETAINSYYSIY